MNSLGSLVKRAICDTGLYIYPAVARGVSNHQQRLEEPFPRSHGSWMYRYGPREF